MLFVNPGIEFSVSDLASRVDTSLPTALRDVRRLSEAGIFSIRATGNMRLVSVNREHPLYQALSEVVLYSFGPLEILRDKFADLEGVTAAYIFGSWAARYSGEQELIRVMWICCWLVSSIGPRHSKLPSASRQSARDNVTLKR